jgi:hypothetical protein
MKVQTERRKMALILGGVCAVAGGVLAVLFSGDLPLVAFATLVGAATGEVLTLFAYNRVRLKPLLALERGMNIIYGLLAVALTVVSFVAFLKTGKWVMLGGFVLFGLGAVYLLLCASKELGKSANMVHGLLAVVLAFGGVVGFFATGNSLVLLATAFFAFCAVWLLGFSKIQ